MQCFHPITIKNPKKQRGPMDSMALQVPCGKCPACLKKRQNEWAFRILQESKLYPESSYFVTLTYDDSHLPTIADEFTGELFPTLDKQEVQKFLSKLRTYMARDGLGSFRYFLCGEYGSRLGRPHYHMAFFSDHVFTDDELSSYLWNVWRKCEPFEVVVKRIGIESAEYVAKYSCKQFGVDYSNVQSPFGLMSRRPAIGSSWLSSKDAKKVKSDKSFVVFDEKNTPFNLPRFYREKVFDKAELYARSIRVMKDSFKRDKLIAFRSYDSLSDFWRRRYTDLANYEKRLIKELRDEF